MNGRMGVVVVVVVAEDILFRTSRMALGQHEKVQLYLGWLMRGGEGRGRGRGCGWCRW